MKYETSIATKIEAEPDYVEDGDVILIMTANHSYQFAVSDSQARRGLLTGGALGERQFMATSSSLIEQGYSARFDVGLANSVCRILTSDVIDLVCIRKGEQAGQQTIRFPYPDTSDFGGIEVQSQSISCL
jgi:hypothetical protein